MNRGSKIAWYGVSGLLAIISMIIWPEILGAILMVIVTTGILYGLWTMRSRIRIPEGAVSRVPWTKVVMILVIVIAIFAWSPWQEDSDRHHLEVQKEPAQEVPSGWQKRNLDAGESLIITLDEWELWNWRDVSACVSMTFYFEDELLGVYPECPGEKHFDALETFGRTDRIVVTAGDESTPFVYKKH